MRGIRLHLSVSNLVFQTDPGAFPLDAGGTPLTPASVEQEDNQCGHAHTDNDIFRVFIHTAPLSYKPQAGRKAVHA